MRLDTIGKLIHRHSHPRDVHVVEGTREMEGKKVVKPIG